MREYNTATSRTMCHSTGPRRRLELVSPALLSSPGGGLEVVECGGECDDGTHHHQLNPHLELYSSCLDLAIQSLDSLNDQIVQFIFTPKACDFDADADDDDSCMQPKQREALKTSMALMRRLLLDAQSKFRKMVEDNKQLATRIDGDIQSAHEEVSVLRAELADTNRRINQLACITTTATTNSTTPTTTPTPPPPPPPQPQQQQQQQPMMTADNDVSAPSSRCPRCQNCTHRDENQVLDEEVCQLKLDSDKLVAHNRSLQREVDELKRLKEHFLSEDNDQKPRIQKLEDELQMAKDALTALKADRKRLKAEKFDLLNQMKQLYGTLEDKERELRDFIRNYEQRMKESDESLKQIGSFPKMSSSLSSRSGPDTFQLAAERDETEREKWSILKHARDESERSVTLCAQLGLKETQLKQVQDELSEARKQLSQLGYYSDQESVTSHRAANGFHTPTATTPVNLPNGRDHTPTSSAGTPGPPADTPVEPIDSEGSPVYAGRAMSVCNDSSPPPTMQGLSRSAEELTHMLSTLDLKKKGNRRNGGSKGTWGSISRVFSRSRSRRSIDGGALFEEREDKRTSWSPYTSLCASPLAEESYSEKLRLLEEAQAVPMERWRASTVLAWLELSLGMPQYASNCAENIKSGKILLELTDGELEAGLGIANPMHRRKLRLAIEEHRDPSLCQYPKIGELTHAWVCGEWLPGLGLSQYIDAFSAHLVDGRMLDRIGRKEMEKFLGVTRKFHQASILHGIQLLRMMEFDKQSLCERRAMSDNSDTDPLIWSNQRFIKWCKSIDLAEYADNLRDSGVHGSLVVLESSFTADTMAAALGIPQSKNIIRRHLTTELDALVQPARLSLEQEAKSSKRDKSGGGGGSSGIGSIGRNFSRSYAGGLHVAKSSETRRSSLRGSLSRALGLKVKQDHHHHHNQHVNHSLPPPSPRSPQHHHNPTTTTTTIKSQQQQKPVSSSSSAVESHRRVKSSGDIEIVTVTPV